VTPLELACTYSFRIVSVPPNRTSDPQVTEDPSESTFKTYEESGTDLGQALITKKKLSDVKGAMPAEMAKALGKLSGGLYVVTAAQGTARSGMIASWVSQASFEPLGFTIAVAKDRAIESLMQVGR
jgi:hypothetical protein